MVVAAETAEQAESDTQPAATAAMAEAELTVPAVRVALGVAAVAAESLREREALAEEGVGWEQAMAARAALAAAVVGAPLSLLAAANRQPLWEVLPEELVETISVAGPETAWTAHPVGAAQQPARRFSSTWAA